MNNKTVVLTGRQPLNGFLDDVIKSGQQVLERQTQTVQTGLESTLKTELDTSIKSIVTPANVGKVLLYSFIALLVISLMSEVTKKIAKKIIK